MALITCDTHGKQEQTFVCQHVIDTLNDGEPRGFHWNKSGDTYQAICSGCNAMTDEEFAKAESEIIAVICLGCFEEAAAVHGVDLD